MHARCEASQDGTIPETILVVEDDPHVQEAVELVLQRAGYEVVTASDGSTALTVAETNRPSLVVLDLMLPGLDGFEVCQALRRASTVPIIMLTARTDTRDVLAGLELGADDYVTKPFVPAELAARVRAVLRRSTAEAVEQEHRDLRVHETAFRAFKGGRELELTTMEMRLLVELVRSAGHALSREDLLERVWGYDYLGDSRLVDMAIKRLRDKLGTPPDDPPYISTVRGVGYRMEADLAGEAV